MFFSNIFVPLSNEPPPPPQTLFIFLKGAETIPRVEGLLSAVPLVQLSTHLTFHNMYFTLLFMVVNKANITWETLILVPFLILLRFSLLLYDYGEFCCSSIPFVSFFSVRCWCVKARWVTDSLWVSITRVCLCVSAQEWMIVFQAALPRARSDLTFPLSYFSWHS